MTQAQPAADYQAEAKFWQLKYFELLGHTNQIITALSRPMLESVVAEQFAGLIAHQQAAQPQPTQQVEVNGQHAHAEAR